MVAHRLAEGLRERDTAGEWRITLLAEESRPAYDRVNLSSYFDGAGEADLRLPGATFEGDDLVELRLSEPVTAVDRGGRSVTTGAGATYRYDALVLATGSRPFVPPVPGHDLPGCFVFRTIDDLDAISAAATALTAGGPGGAGVVIGGGLLGLEAANALRLLGLEAHVVEIAPHLMSVQVDEGGGALLGRMLAQLGVAVHCGTGVAAVHSGEDGRTSRVELADGTVLETGLVVFAAGIRPRDEIGRAAGLPVGQRGGIVTDETCRTEDRDIYAIGECACVNGRVYGLAAPGYAMAETTADRLLGGDATFGDPDTSTKLKLLGVDVASFGDAHGTTGSAPGRAEQPAGRHLRQARHLRRHQDAARRDPGRRRLRLRGAAATDRPAPARRPGRPHLSEVTVASTSCTALLP
jgi:nitrite reductase (NADH) large subunit